MAYDDEPLNFEEMASLKNLDEQIDQRLRRHSRPADQQDALDPQLLRDLADVYQPRAQRFQSGLDRVWGRLEQQGIASAQQQQRTNGPIPRPGFQYERSQTMQRIFRSGQRWSARVTTLVAVALLAVLVGGLTLGLILVHRTGNHTAGGPTPTSSPTGRSSPTPSPTPGSGQAIGLTSIHMIDATTGWAEGPVVKPWRILRTTDGGAHWQDVTPPSAPQMESAIPAYFLNASTAWIAAPEGDGSTARFFRTTDGGQTWQRVGSFQTVTPFYMSFVNAQDGWALGNFFGATGSEAATLFRTTDGGQTWTTVASTGTSSSNPGTIPFEGTKRGLTFLDASTGWMTGFSNASNFFQLFVTHDGGVTWQNQPLPLPPGVTQAQQAQFDVAAPTFFNARDGVLPVQIEGLTGNPELDIYVTHDGGTTWQSTSLVQTSDQTVDFSDANHGWATDGTTLFATSNGGQTWTKLPASSVFQNVTSLNFVSATTGWAISEPPSGAFILLKTTDGGQTWAVVNPTL